MEYKKAVRVAVLAMLKEKKTCAVEANLYLNYGSRNAPQGLGPISAASVSAYTHHEELTEAIKVLQQQQPLLLR